MPFLQLPAIPAPHAELPSYLAQHPDMPMTELFEPYRKHEARLRELYAQEPGHPALTDPHVNVLPLFTENTHKLQVRARDPEAQPVDVRSKYIMPLPKENRRPSGSPAVVSSIKDFQANFTVFSESSLAMLAGTGWDNVVAAGSSVVNCLLPVPEQYSGSRRLLREYYHEKFCPASDVDLFLYGLTEEQAVEKIKEIEACVRDSILAETTTVRTKHAITICSEYPTRHVQIVLRIYKSVSEILAGFDIDCSGAAYDGKQVYCTPRALQAYMTQVNHIDLTRRSPSYENRLSKYSHRNFEVFWDQLDRPRVDPTIFERSFNRTLGLARLLVLERLPTTHSRRMYAAQRRTERGRPQNSQSLTSGLIGNIKDDHEDEVAEWITPDDINNYDTFVLPYGRKYHAKRIEKMCYTRDLQWNQKKDREVYLHRHPAFFGRAEDVMEDCCGFCPKPQTDREKEIAEEESKIYISGKISFMTDDPGRQQIGSFNPLTDDDWTEMAYVGNTARLCQAIVDGDLEHVEDWLAQDGVDPNRRDYTGRTPLHLAVMASTPAIVQKLVDHGARLIARVADGRTALHLAAQRGDAEMVKILMDKSNQNEAEEAEKEDRHRAAKLQATEEERAKKREEAVEQDEEDSDGELIDDEVSDDDVHSTTTASFVKVKSKKGENQDGDADINETDDEPDFYDINALAWDRPCSALHLAIIGGYDEVVKLLCQEYGADILLPVKYEGTPYSRYQVVILTLAMALALPVDKAKSMVSTLLSLGATCSQADMNGITAFYRYVEACEVDLVQLLLDLDTTGAPIALNNLSFPHVFCVISPLLKAISAGDSRMAQKLLENGAAVQIDFDTWLKCAKASVAFGNALRTFEENTKMFQLRTEQPLIVALRSPNPSIALELLKRGADPDTRTKDAYRDRNVPFYNSIPGAAVDKNALDIVRGHLYELRQYEGEAPKHKDPLRMAENPDKFFATLSKRSYLWAAASADIQRVRKESETQAKLRATAQASSEDHIGEEEKKAAIAEMIHTMEAIEAKILATTKVSPIPQEKVYIKQPKPVEFTQDYKFVPQFVDVSDITESRQLGYIELFEAAWNGDLDTIKKLTLAAWGDKKDQPPLAVAVSDRHGNTVFSLAFLRGHWKVAVATLEIVRAQYAPEDKPKVHYEMRNEDDEDTDMDSCCSEHEIEGAYRMIVDNDQFTIENIGEVNMQVKGTVTPLQLLAKSVATFTMHDGEVTDYETSNGSLFRYVFEQNDPKGLKFLLDTATHFANQTADDATGYYTFPVNEFISAIGSGRTEMLAEVIKRTGAGLPLEEMVKESGAPIEQPHHYYQGLTVYGKKRSDWAEAGRHTAKRSTGMTASPLLHAASTASLESVEWFLSDAPLRCYLEFIASKAAQEDPRIAQLGQAPGGFEGAVSSWLTKNSHLLLFRAIECGNHKKALPVIQYLVKVAPDMIHSKNEGRLTPLMLACMLGRLEVVKLLLDQGADPTQRHELTFANLLHAALFYNPRAKDLQGLLDLLDDDAVAHMFCERTHHASWSKSSTPLHAWLTQYMEFTHRWHYVGVAYQYVEEVLDVIRLLLKHSGGRELNVIDGAGETPVHMLIHQQAEPKILLTILESIPRQLAVDLLLRENAAGDTPLELAKGMFLASFIEKPRDDYYLHNSVQVRSWRRQDPHDFVVSVKKDGQVWKPIPERLLLSNTDAMTRAKEILAAVTAFLEGVPSKRLLVSLNEANYVAKRVGHQYEKERYAVQVAQPAADVDGQKDDESKPDPMALGFDAYRYRNVAWPRKP